MVDVRPLTSGEIMNALRVRDELASRIRGVSAPGLSARYRVEKAHAQTIAEGLISQGLIDVAAVHGKIVDPDTDEEDDDEDLLADL